MATDSLLASLLVLVPRAFPFFPNPRNLSQFNISIDYGGEAVRDLSNMTEDQVKEVLQELNALGEVALKANVLPWQESVPQDTDTIVYDAHDPRQHMI